jgi:hypothetical protein
MLREPLPVLACVAVIVFGKPLAAWLLLRALGHSDRMASTIAASVSQIGEFSFILAGLAISLRLMPSEGRDLVLAGALISIVLNPVVFASVVRWQKRQRGEIVADDQLDLGPPIPTGPHGIMIGYGRVGSQLAALLRTRGMQLSPDCLEQGTPSYTQSRFQLGALPAGLSGEVAPVLTGPFCSLSLRAEHAGHFEVPITLTRDDAFGSRGGVGISRSLQRSEQTVTRGSGVVRGEQSFGGHAVNFLGEPSRRLPSAAGCDPNPTPRPLTSVGSWKLGVGS